MKKESFTSTKTSAPRKPPVRRANAPSAVKPSSTGGDAACTRLEVAAPSALAMLEPAPRPGTVVLRRVRFGYFKPDAREVHVVGSFNGWDPRATPMTRDAVGDWSVDLPLAPGEHRYRFFVDGEWCDDPAAQQTARNPFGGFDAVMPVL